MLLARVLSGVLLAAVAIAGCGGASETVRNTIGRTAPAPGAEARSPGAGPLSESSQRHVSLVVSPSTGGKHDRFTVTITTRSATGVLGKTRRGYLTEAHAARPAIDCVNNRDGVFPDVSAGARARAELDPARGEGGPQGWCPGLFRGTVTYFEAFACPATGTCEAPHGFPTLRRVVVRFSFRVR